MLARESIQNEIRHWEQTKNTVASAFQDAGHHTLGHHHHNHQASIDEDGDAERGLLMPAGLEGAVPLPLGTPEARPGSHNDMLGEGVSGEEVVWFPRGPEEDMDLDAGQNQLLAEIRGGNSRGEDKGGEL